MTDIATQLKHDTPEFKAIADNGLILRAKVGSHLYGTNLPGAADRDELGICIEPPEHVIGLHTYNELGLNRFDQYETRTQPAGTRSGFGDLDYTCYSLRKFAYQAAKGNPTTITHLFLPTHTILHLAWPGQELLTRRDLFLGRHCTPRFIHYLEQQRDRILGGFGHTNRPELTTTHGYDTKYASHALRLGLQGIELATHGHIILPIPEPHRSVLLAIRQGEIPRDETLKRIEVARLHLITLADPSTYSPLPDTPHLPAINRWLNDTYRQWWKQTKQ